MNAIAMQANNPNFSLYSRCNSHFVPTHPNVGSSRTCRQHFHHSAHTPRDLTSINDLLDPLDQGIEQRVNFFTAAQLVGVQVEHNKSHIRGQTCDAVIPDVLDKPAEDGLKS